MRRNRERGTLAVDAAINHTLAITRVNAYSDVFADIRARRKSCHRPVGRVRAHVALEFLR